MRRHKVFATLVVLGIVGLIAGAIVIAQQQITLTTYYPSPYGEYKEVDIDNVNINDVLTLASANPLPAITGSPGKGQIYYDGALNKLRVAENGSVWTDLVGGGAWTRDGGTGEVTLTTPTDNVTIGPVGGTNILNVNGQIQVNGAPIGFPAPSFDSGWVAIAPGANVTFTHNFGTLNYMISIEGRNTITSSIHNNRIGGDRQVTSAHPPDPAPIPTQDFGAAWWNKTINTVDVVRSLNDGWWGEVRVRLWKW